MTKQARYVFDPLPVLSGVFDGASDRLRRGQLGLLFLLAFFIVVPLVFTQQVGVLDGEYESELRLFGWPLLAFGAMPRGWLSFGGAPVGFLAVGGAAVGVVAIGGLSVGVVAIGGLSLALVAAAGGLALGYYALGGLCFGALAYAGGGVALGFFVAAGGRYESLIPPRPEGPPG